MSNRTNVFVKEGFNPLETLSIKPLRTIYRIDDCDVAQSVMKFCVDERLTVLKDLFGNKLSKYVNSYSEILDENIPVMTQEDYLKEIKDEILKSKSVCLGNLNRLFIKASDGMEVGNVIITNRYKNKLILVNELYKNGEFVCAAEYDLEEMLEKYEAIMSI